MERMVGRARFYRELNRRGFSAVENAGQVVVFCNCEPLHLTSGTAQTLKESLQANPDTGFDLRVSAKL
jgi:hypothetical protein